MTVRLSGADVVRELAAAAAAAGAHAHLSAAFLPLLLIVLLLLGHVARKSAPKRAKTKE